MKITKKLGLQCLGAGLLGGAAFMVYVHGVPFKLSPWGKTWVVSGICTLSFVSGRTVLEIEEREPTPLRRYSTLKNGLTLATVALMSFGGFGLLIHAMNPPPNWYKVGLVCELSASAFAAGIFLEDLERKQSSCASVPEALLDSKKRGVAKVLNDGVDLGTREGFTELFHQLKDELVEEMQIYEMTQDATAHLKRMLEYNVPGGKLNRGLTVVHTARRIRGGKLDQEEERRIAVLGWCIEWIQASFLVSDDIMDSSITRRGQACWYKLDDIGLIAINDALILMTQVEVLLHKYWGNSPHYKLLHGLLTETIYQTELGQNLDLTTQPPSGQVNLDLYTEERHALIVKYKTAFYSFYAPIALGMIACGETKKDSLDLARSICIKMGTYFQIQDDYLDCYGTPEMIGKIGTDIQDSKCSWLVVQALKRANSEQRAALRANYGKDDPENIAKVKEIYQQLDLEQIYKSYEEDSYQDLVKEIDTVDSVPPAVFLDLLNKIYKRQK